MQTYIVYIGMFVVALLFAKLAELSKNKAFIFVVIAVFSLVAGLRHESVGLDTPGYVNAIEYIIEGQLKLAYGMEWSFRYICYALSFVLRDPQLYLLFFAVVTNLLIVLRLWEMREQISFSWAVFAYYSVFFMSSINLTRQYVAVAIVFYATRYLLKGKNITFLLLVIVASLFHTSALLSIICIYFNLFNWKNLSKRHKRFLIFSIIVIPFVGIYAYSNLVKYSSYLGKMTVDFGFMLLVKMALMIVTIFLLDKTESDSSGEISKLRRFTRCAYIVGLALTSIGYAWRFVDRIGLFFYVYEAVYMGYIFKQQNTRANFFIKMFVFALFSYLFLTNITGNGQGQGNYIFFWQ